MSHEIPVSIDDIRAAADRLAGMAVRTPLLESPLLNERLGARLLVKAEPLQRTGSFKFRGAYNAIAQIPAAERGRGVVGLSSG
ncbi:MAG: pyridoxal-phosphate dependent enzyme, partial [Azospirillaceae bacterium]